MAKKWDKGAQTNIAILFLLLITITAYLPALRANFVNFDDDKYVIANPNLQAGLTAEGFKWAFNMGYQGNWHPLTWMSHMLDIALFGLNPVGPHAVNLLLHLANTLLLFFVLKRMTKSLWKSAFVAALFAVHPMHVESVAWVAERKDVLSTLFWMLTMWAYVRYTEAPAVKRYAVVLLCFALGLMSKPTLVTLPIVLLLLDYWPMGRWSGVAWRRVKEKLPLFAMSAASCVITYLAQQRGETVRTFTELPFASRIENMLTTYVSYIAKMLWPAKLAVFYPHPISIPIWQALAAVVFLATVTILVMRSAQSRHYLLVGWLWYLIVLIPMIGLVQVGRQAMADRYSYVSFIGLFIMIAWGASDLFSRRVSVSPGLRVIPYLAIVILAGCTWRQAGFWRDSVTLWTHTLAVTTGNNTSHYNLGNTYAELGMYAEAIEEYKNAIRIAPDVADVHYNLGNAYAALGRYSEAAENFKQEIRIRPDCVDAYSNLGGIYANLGKYAEAVDSFKQAIRINPNYALAHLNLGFTYLSMGNKPLAMNEYKALTKLNPEMANRLFGLINK